MTLNTIQIINTSMAFFIFVFFFLSFIISLAENEKPAAIKFLFTGIIISALICFVSFYLYNLFPITLWIFDGIILIILCLLFLPLKGKFNISDDTPKTIMDERNTMFSRKELIPGTNFFTEYYNNNPDKKELDDKFRSKPGLTSKGSTKYNPIIYAAAEANFNTVAQYKNNLDGKISEEKIEVNKHDITSFIKNWSIQIGAKGVGITELKPYHFYHTKGRGDSYNKKVENNHKYVIAIIVEMDKFLMDTAPDAPTILESSQKYLSSGTIAVQVANLIRNLGYPAKAHIDGNYDVICPLIARDAGLGEIGRMGLLMTNELGPRTRISVVTTDIPLQIDNFKREPSTIHFCEICKKCADICPSSAISFEKRETIDNTLRWQINSEACYTYWCSVGTDCGKCIKVCPFSHPNNWLHNIIRFGIKNNFIFRQLALLLDNFYYGRRPLKSNYPKWMRTTKPYDKSSNN